MKTPEEIKRGLECGNCDGCPYARWDEKTGQFADHHCEFVETDALAYIQQLERDNSQKDEHIMWLEMMNAEYKHVLRYIKHAADMGVHEDTDELALLGIHMGRGAEEEKHGEE